MSNTPFDRRTFLGAASLAAASRLLSAQTTDAAHAGRDFDVEEVSITQLQTALSSGKISSAGLVHSYLYRIAKLDPAVNAILELNPDALAIAASLDAERKSSGPRGPLHGIPILLKGNIDTADKMQTTAGSLALIGPPPAYDSTTASRLRAAGAVILGKTNLSEWANFRSSHSTSGWSGVGGQTNNPYFLDRNPSGSSSGSGAAASASFVAASIGTETDGSIVSPANNNGVVGIKPTVGLTSRAGVVPLSHSQDTIGPHGRTVTDAAIVLGAMTGWDLRDPATAGSVGKSYKDYTQFLDPNGLKGARIGVLRKYVTGYSYEADAIFANAIQAIQNAGATIVDPADLPTADQIANNSPEFTVLLYDFKNDINAYLAARTGLSSKTLADLIAFNNANASKEMPFFQQETFLAAQATTNLNDPAYISALALNHSLSREQGIDAVLAQYNLDALIAPTGSPAWTTDLVNSDHFLGASSGYAAMAGYPIVTLPAGSSFGLPVNISFIGTAYSEPTLIKLAYSFEQATKARRAPQFLESLKLGCRNACATDESSHAWKSPNGVEMSKHPHCL